MTETIKNDDYIFNYISNKSIKNIMTDEIKYFFSDKRKICMVKTDNEKIEFYGKLSDIEADLSKVPFVRTHQSYLVNYYLIRSRTKIEITLVNGKKLPISEERQKYFNQQCSHLLGGEINV